ncbi:2OG-Fe(II) oxygenase [Bacillus sp. SD075]|uniref:2OG-Fe(II) oxygenase n=1 Tax=Bacillus sp. SD075 TaxID=2781732 RepID=UPI001A959BF3|nr:2OG-Fe(II) oxygenase [Bacillus sp. SD075]MBO0998538.1 2OG-Fe(II) oxygenase [Bacillus sp. SD075]
MTVDNKIRKEQTIFNHIGNTIQTEDREINVIAKLEEPLVVVLGNVLSEEECDGLIELSKNKMHRSKTGVTHEVNEIRTSSSMFFQENEYDIITKIEKRISTIMNIPLEHGDGIQILKYTPGQEYKAHFDFFTSSSTATKNNRISTIIMYLNDVEHGGETFFPKLNFSVSPRKGMAVYFEYFYNDKNINERTLHGGAPVITGEKWVATQWMRRQK